jgi:hypothetical protein
MLSLKKLQEPKHCSHDFSKGVLQSEDFPNPQGFFMTEDVAVTNLSRELFYHHTGSLQRSRMSCDGSKDGAVCDISVQIPAQLFLIPVSEPYSLVPGQGRAVFECPTIDTVNKAKNLSAGCLHLSNRLFPSDIWRQNKTFERFSRHLLFNNPEPVFAVQDINQEVPKIAHILKFDGIQSLSPMCFASIQSAFTKGELQHVFVHGHLDKRTPDPLWQQLVNQFEVTHIPTPSISSSTSISQQLLYGMNMLLQYGGVLLSCDTLIQESLAPMLQYPVVTTVQKSKYRIIHHHIDFALIVSQPAALYLQTLIPVLKQLVESGSDRDFGAVAYHVYEQYPSSALIDSSLVGHLVCTTDKCLPAEGQLDVRRAYAAKYSWPDGTPPSSLKDLAAITGKNFRVARSAVLEGNRE